MYPIGIVLWFAQNKNPNNLFPGTSWRYIGENRTIRLATANGSDVLSTGGSDTVILTVNNLPAHGHSFSGNTSSFDYGSKTTNYSGLHYHDSGWGDDHPSNARHGTYDNTLNNFGANRADSNNSKYNTSLDGNHSHTVSIGAHKHSFSGTTANSGSGVAINVKNAYVMLMGWYRTA